MFRIDDASAAASLPVPEAAGVEGFWTEGNPANGIPATLERASWFNMIQEELRAVVVAGGQAPSKTTYNQLLSALTALYGSGRIGHTFVANDWVPLPGGLILQWGTITGSAASITTALPIAFPVGMIGRVASLQDKSSGSLTLPVYVNTSLASRTQIGVSMAGYDSGNWTAGFFAIGY